jgi:hypothetical protein
MRKILAISAFGKNPRYIIGAYKQVHLAKYFYPDFERWLFVDNPNIYKLDAKVIAMPANTDGQFWRFLAGSEHAAVIFRDADSRITLREAGAVEEWLQSGKKLHLIRDHDRHNPNVAKIFAGNFGFRGPWPIEILVPMIEAMNASYQYGRDQDFLRDYVYPVYEHNILTHATDGWFGETRQKMTNPYEFAGQGWDEEDLPLYAPSNENFDEHDRLSLPDTARFSQYPENI